MIKPYFSHDLNTRSDEKIKRLLVKHGWAGYGLYWSIVEDLYHNANAIRTDYESIAYDLRTDEKTIKSIVEDFDLFVVKGEKFGSMSVQRRLDKQEEKSEKARESARYRWQECERNTNASEIECERNAIKKSKVKKENKEKKINKEPPEIPSEFLDLSFSFHSRQKNNGLYHKDFGSLTEHSPVVLAGAKELHDLVRLDKIPIENINKVLEFIPRDDFWKKNCVSLAGLRKKGKNGNTKFGNILNSIKPESFMDRVRREAYGTS